MATPAGTEAEIHVLMAARVEAVKAKDAARLVEHHDADGVVYDLLEPLQYTGLDAYDGPMAYEIRDLVVVAGFEWRVVHEHSSLPFDRGRGKVSFARKP